MNKRQYKKTLWRRDFNSYMCKIERDGFIDSNGHPLKCVRCGSRKFKEGQSWRGPIGVEEYMLVCTVCKNNVGHWAYGSWQV